MIANLATDLKTIGQATKHALGSVDKVSFP
jgi:hypothetical protein